MTAVDGRCCLSVLTGRHVGCPGPSPAADRAGRLRGAGSRRTVQSAAGPPGDGRTATDDARLVPPLLAHRAARLQQVSPAAVTPWLLCTDLYCPPTGQPRRTARQTRPVPPTGQRRRSVIPPAPAGQLRGSVTPRLICTDLYCPSTGQAPHICPPPPGKPVPCLQQVSAAAPSYPALTGLNCAHNYQSYKLSHPQGGLSCAY